MDQILSFLLWLASGAIVLFLLFVLVNRVMQTMSKGKNSGAAPGDAPTGSAESDVDPGSR